eukprot:4965309-Prymnesium_polylepis.1
MQQELVAREKAKRLAKTQDKVEKQHIYLDDKPTTPKQEPLEEQVEVTRKPKKPKKKVVVMHDSSDSDRETQVIYIPKTKSNKPNMPRASSSGGGPENQARELGQGAPKAAHGERTQSGSASFLEVDDSWVKP